MGQGGPGTDSDVVGEVYEIEPALERKLDEIEMLYPEQTDEYFKREIPVLVGSCVLDCLIYEINPAYVKERPLILGGDWFKSGHLG